MPRKALVSVEDAIAVIENFFDDFQAGSYPRWSSEVWKLMSNALDGKWSKENVYTNVTNNRRNIMAIACANQNVPFVQFKSRGIENTLDEPMSDTSIILNNNEDSVQEYEEETTGLDHFEVRLTSTEWKQMREQDVMYNDNKTYPMLRRKVWTDILALAIDRQMELPCAFIFDKSKIYETPGSVHYMRVTGFCKSRACGNRLFCYLYEEPRDHDVNIIVRTRDTFYDKHEKVERPLRGIRRQHVGQQVFNEGCANWRKREVLANTRFGGRVPSHIPNLNVLQQAKKEHVDNKLGIKSTDGKDLIKTIESMKYSAPYHGFIHEVQRDKFYVSFSTTAQLHAYKQYCRLVKNFSTVSIDGTGSLVKPLIREDGSSSGHIFLYSVTINFNNTTLSVYDMLTESQDTDVIWWWLKKWQKLGGPKPRQVVCDSSRALMNGISLAFNYQTVKVYVETCFLYATGNPEYLYRSPIFTYLRLDIPHLMNMVRRWNCFKHMRHTVVRQFYLYCVGLMIDSQTLKQFEEIFYLTCIVGVNEFQDSIIRHTGCSVLSARKRLEGYIATRSFDLDFEKISGCEEGNIHAKNETEEELSTDNSRIKKWINDLRKKAEVTEHLGSELNSFYFTDFIDRFMSIAHEFPLWTAVAIPHVAEHALTTFVEGHFNMIKHGVLKNYSGLLRADKLLKLIFEDYSGSATLLTSKLKVFNQNNGPYVGPAEKPDVFQRPKTTDTLQTSEIGLLPPKVQRLKGFVTPRTANINSIVRSSPDHHDTVTGEVNNNENEECFEDENKNIVGIKIHLANDVTRLNARRMKTKECVDNQLKVETSKAKGKYFKPNRDIQYRDTLAANIQRSWLLKNGSVISQPAHIDGSYYFAYNTCGFDSIVQILSASAMDDPEYMAFIQKSSNESLQFVASFIKNGPCSAIYKQRILHLKRHFETNISANYDQCAQLISYSIDLYDNLNTIWSKCFNSEPSLCYTYQCPKCDVYNSSVPTLFVNHNTIGEHGFSALQRALALYSEQHQRSCISEYCSEMCQVKITYNTQIFIELDIRPNLQYSTGMTCSLNDFPVHLDLNSRQYRLSGVIVRLPGHYVAYCRRINSHWEMCNDTKSNITHCRTNTHVEPHGVIYIASSDAKGVKEIPFQSLDTLEHDTSSSIKTSTPRNVCEAENDATVNMKGNFENISSLTKHHNRLRFSAAVPLDDSDVIKRDNWRNKEVLNNTYFEKSFDETEEANFVSQNQNKESIHTDISSEYEQVLMLRIGNVMPGIVIDQQILHLRDTYNFDSIVHIIVCSALDDPVYMASIEKSHNETLQFAVNLIEMKPCADIYRKRAVLLKSLYSSKIFKEVENNIDIYKIDLRENLTRTWEKCLKNEPSVLNIYACGSCGTYTLSKPVLTVDQNLIVRKGYTALNEALNFVKELKKVKCCQEHCIELCTVTAYPNFHLYIELDVKSNDRSQTKVKCKLQNFPTKLILKGQSGYYRLRGIVAATSEHVVAHCLRDNNHWETYDGYSISIESSDVSQAIKPHCAIYVYIPSEE